MKEENDALEGVLFPAAAAAAALHALLLCELRETPDSVGAHLPYILHNIYIRTEPPTYPRPGHRIGDIFDTHTQGHTCCCIREI